MKYLGKQTAAPETEQEFDPEEFDLECVPNPSPANWYAARFTIPEFTSLCPVTGQPDFATMVIDYVPRDLLVESKALKLYMATFRNHGAFHEACTNAIADKIMAVANPWYLRVDAFWYPRGGIPIDVFCERPQKAGAEYVTKMNQVFRDMVPNRQPRNYRGR